MDRNLGMDLVRVTEAAALESSRLMGRGDDVAVDKAAIEAMRQTFDTIAIDGTVVIGEGPEDAISMLYVGERVGTGQRAKTARAAAAIGGAARGPKTDGAVGGIEGPATCATGGYNALAVIAVADAGSLFRVPDTYMDKIACGPEGRGVIDLDRSPADNVRALAEAKGMYVEDLTVVVLDRPRHLRLIEQVRAAGARI